jgi:hypothetical protein
MNTYAKPSEARDLRDHRGRLVLAEGEQTGHCHEVIDVGESIDDAIPPADFFEEPSGRRVLLANRRCALRHDEHGLIALDPAAPVQVRQGDVFLNPIGDGAWEVIRQREYSPTEIRNVAD